MKFTVILPEKVSLNKIYSGIHFRERMRHKEDYAWAVKESGVGKWCGTFPVAMHYHFRVKGSRLDVSNHAYMLKMTEDALVYNETLPGDDPKYVGRITITADKAEKDEPDTVEVTIESFPQS